MAGSYLRTNYRKTGGIADITAIGGGFAIGSWGGGSGTPLPYGGFVMGSFASAAFSAMHPISAVGAMSEYFGSGLFGAGYKIFPFMVKNASVPNDAVASVVYAFDWSLSGSLFWVIGNKMSSHLISVSTASGPVLGAPSILASNESIHFVWAGYIVSGP